MFSNLTCKCGENVNAIGEAYQVITLTKHAHFLGLQRDNV